MNLISRQRTRNDSGQLGKYIYRLDFILETVPQAKIAAGKTPGATSAPSEEPPEVNMTPSDSPEVNLTLTRGQSDPKPEVNLTPHNQSVKPINKPIKSSDQKTNSISLPTWLDQSNWSDYKTHRKEIKKPMSAMAEKKAITMLTKLRDAGDNPNDVINNSIVNGWAGLFPINNAKQKPPEKKPKERLDFNTWDGKLIDYQAMGKGN